MREFVQRQTKYESVWRDNNQQDHDPNDNGLPDNADDAHELDMDEVLDAIEKEENEIQRAFEEYEKEVK